MSQIESIYSPQVEEQLKRIYSDLEKHQKKVLELSKMSVDFYGGKTASKPADLSQTELQLKRLQLQQERLRQSEERLIISGNRLNTQKEKQKQTTANLNRAYVQLAQAHTKASNTLQDLTARGRLATQTQGDYNRELTKARSNFNVLNQKVINANKAVGRFNYNVGNYPKNAVVGIKNLIGAFGIVGGVSLFATVVKDAFRLTKELQGLNQALKQVTGTQEEYLSQQLFLKEIANDFGVEINGLTKQFTQFYVSAKDKIAGEDIQQIFKSVTKAGAIMGLSVESQERAFLALNQMMSKGVVSAEELRGQLGEALPGAFGIMAKALNTNEVGLNKMLKSGSLLASDVLPKFAKALEETYGIETIERVDNLTSAQNRLGNSWTNLIKTITEGEGGITAFLTNIVNGISDTINAWDRLLLKMKSTKTIFNTATTEGETFYFKQVQDEAKKTGISVEKLATTRIGLAIKMKDSLVEEIRAIREQNKEMEKGTPNKFIRDLSGMSSMISKNNDKIRDKIDQLGRVNGQLKAYTAILKPAKEQEQISTESIKENNNALIKNVEIRKEQIKSVQDLIKLNEVEPLGIDITELEKQISAFEELRKKKQDDLEALKEWSAEYRKTFQDDFISNSGFDKIFFIIENFDKLKDSGVDTALAISEAFQQTFNTISQASQGNFDREYERLEMQKEIALKFAGESTTAREEIERQAEEKRKQIQRREAEAQKKIAIFNIIVDTAQAIVASVAKSPLTGGLPFSAIAGAIGAAQIALVSSQQIPQFWKGVENSSYEGWATKDERGAEIQFDKKGNIKDFGQNKGAKYTYVEKGDTIWNANKTKELLSLTSFSKDYGNLLFKNQILPPVINNSNNFDFSGVEGKISDLTNEIRHKKTATINVYKDKVITRSGSAELTNARLTIKGRSV